MKAKIFILLITIGMSYAMQAQTSHEAITEQQNSEMTVQQTAANTSENLSINYNSIANESESSLFDMSTNIPTIPDEKNEKNQKKGDMKTWHYVAIGVVAVAIIVFAIVAPEGYNSRTGI